MPVVRNKNKKTKGEQIRNWWSNFEQESLVQSFRYRLMFISDITDCYGSIYTHSIVWALHGKDVGKVNRGDSLLGNLIDGRIRAMSNGQSNGIPQGSVLMDFIAELVLGYVDLLLDERLRGEAINDGYSILRYRDDYRVFVNDSGLGEKILKELTAILAGMGMRLNSSKTKVSDNIVGDAIKADKLAWLGLQSNFVSLSFEKQLLLLFNHANHYPNGGSLLQPLIYLHDHSSERWLGEMVQISASAAILMELAYRNPRCYQLSMAILAELLRSVPWNEQRHMVEQILDKFKQLPHTGYLQVWLQRIMKPNGIGFDYTERLCRIVENPHESLWNNEWLAQDPILYNGMQSIDVIDRKRVNELSSTMDQEEISVFVSNYQDNYQGEG